MTQYHDPLPPGVTCSDELHQEFEAWFDDYVRLCREGYWCRPMTQMLVAWLGGRRAARTNPRDLRCESDAALDLLRDFGLDEPHAHNRP